MRSKKEIFDLILSIAKKDARVRAVVLNGSRANPNISPDIFQDFDIAFLVDNLKSIVEDKNWHKQFGEILIMQTPETMNDPPPDNNGKFTYLLLFT
ncbi:MAG TPA: aminoglycoside 6-adenylyltransferase, partial [Trueperaceae bacterium]|nr:aminoglycoside 6-adenylyltransferase [Trueperaceae bacterium]